MPETQTADIGHNRPPLESDLPDRLNADYEPLLKRKAELLAGAANVPTELDDDTAPRVADFVKQIGAAIKSLDVARVAEKEPYLAGGRAVDTFFKNASEPLAKAKGNIERVLTSYQRKREAEERRRREEEERKAREAAEAAAKEAAERAKALEDESQLARAIEAEAAAKQAAADAAKAQKAADAKAAELSRMRGDLGSVTSLRTFWDFTDLDRATLDLEALRQHLPQDALEKAVRSYIKAGGRNLKGVRIFENTKSQVR